MLSQEDLCEPYDRAFAPKQRENAHSMVRLAHARVDRGSGAGNATTSSGTSSSAG